MSTLSSLSRTALGARLAGPGLTLRTGAFTLQLRSAIPAVADGLALLYADYPLLAADAWTDFQLDLVRPSGPRRWWRPQVRLVADGAALFQPMPLAQALPMFEWGLNWCIANQAHNYLMIHAAVLEQNGRALILPAPPGSGKSTLCAALAHRGWRLLSDELTLLRLDDGLVQPAPRPISLKNASIALIRDYLGSAAHARFSPAVHDTIKGTVAHLRAPDASVLRAAEPARPAWVVFPQYEAGAVATLAPLSKAHAHLQLAANSFNYSLLAADGFNALAGLVSQSGCYTFRYSALDDGVATFAALAERP